MLQIAEIAESAIATAGKYLTFTLDRETYGIQILKVRELIGMQEITRVPDTEHYLKGVINLRGQVIAVIDLRVKFGMTEVEPDRTSCIVIVESGETWCGFIVDRVQEVVDLTSDQIEPNTRLGSKCDTGFIYGLGKAKDHLVLLLDSDVILQKESDQIDAAAR